MNKTRQALEEELSELWQEYDNYYEASKDIMAQIHMVEADLEKLDVLTQVHNWKYENYCPLEVVDGGDSSSLTLQWETSVHKVLESCEDKYGKQIEYLFQQVITYHQEELFSLLEEYISRGYKKIRSEETIHTINLIVKEYFYKENFWGDVESLIRENREDLLKRDVSCIEVVDLREE